MSDKRIEIRETLVKESYDIGMIAKDLEQAIYMLGDAWQGDAADKLREKIHVIASEIDHAGRAIGKEADRA